MALPSYAQPLEALTALLQPHKLDALLETVFADVQRLQVAVAVGRGGEIATATRSPDGKRTSAPPAQPIGCLAKLLTATLAHGAVIEGCFEFDSDVAELLGTRVEALRGVTVRHLLEHTHGLDDSLFRRARHRLGFIHRRELLAQVERLRRFAQPSAIYSYGHLGAWLMASVLERARRRTYDSQVRDGILEPLGACEPANDGPIGPASDSRIALGANELLRFLARSPLGDSAEHGQRSTTPLPGWNPLERGVHLGWKYSTGGWFGHQSVWPKASAYVRVQPQSGFALAVLSRTHAAAVVARRLFGALLPELFDLRPPPLEQGAANAPLRSVQRFEHAAHVVQLEARSLIRVQARDERGRLGPETVASLRPSGGGVLFVEPPHALLPYAQLVTIEGRPWLWTGRAVLGGVA